MSLNMFLAETDSQTTSMNTVHTDIIQAMEQVMEAIDTFTGATLLQGKTYQSAKDYLSITFRTLAQGIIDLSEELLRQNNVYPSDFRSRVATTDVVEEKLKSQIDKIDDLIEEFESVNDAMPLFDSPIMIYREIKRSLQKKLERLYYFNATTSGNYDMALELAEGVAEGLKQLQHNNGFNKNQGTFNLEKMDLAWITKVNEAGYKIKAKNKYPDYYDDNKNNDNNIEKLIEVIQYEENHPEHVKDTDEFLSPLEEKDIVEIKYLMYTAEEPYRTLALQYIDRLEIIKEEVDPDKASQPSYFTKKDNTITYVYEKDRTNNRGSYFTLFHEIGHAIDYNYGYDNQDFWGDVKGLFGNQEYYTEQFEMNEKNLAETMYSDFENTVKDTLESKLKSPDYNDLSSEQKSNMKSNVTNNLLNQDEHFEELSDRERELQMWIEDTFYEQLDGPDNSIASDVYEGITNFAIEGDYGHSDDYWFDNGNRIREPNREGFAEYFGRLMTMDPNGEKPGIESLDRHLPDSKKHMDTMIESMKSNKE